MVDTYLLQPGYAISRVIKGNWQLAKGHNDSNKNNVVKDLFSYAENGIITFDCADIYTGVEEILGRFLKEFGNKYGEERTKKIKIHTKFVPDFNDLSKIDKRYVSQIIERSLIRLGVEKLDLVQFHWWDYDIKNYVETSNFLKELKEEGKIDLIGATNFDANHLSEIVDSGVKIASNQIQYSVIDHRAEKSMVKFCKKNGILLLCYGSLAGGFISGKYLGLKEPQEPLENRSLVKYKLIIDDWGGWNKFQSLLKLLDDISRKHKVSVSDVAVKYVLQKEQVAAVILGSRNAQHIQDTVKIFSFDLSKKEMDEISKISNENNGLSGDIYGLERAKGGKHGAVMKYNLNKKV